MIDTSDRPVPPDRWTIVGGHVQIDGKFVQGGKGVTRVDVRTTCLATCQGCYQHNVTWPLVLWVRYEMAIEREMHWFGPGPGRCPRYCAGCVGRAGEHEDLANGESE